jgi:hypothetical protein
MPQIRAKLEEGVQHSDIIRLLNQQGLDLTERTYQSYLYRFRKEQRAGRSSRGSAPPGLANSAPSTTATRAQPNATSKDSPVGRRPPTFDYDPRGIPDLLK